MLEFHPDRANPGSLRGAANAAKKQAQGWARGLHPHSTVRNGAASGPIVIAPDFSKLKVVGLTHELAESCAPMTITVSYARQDGTPKPFLMIINWIRVQKDWKVASEIILPAPPTPAVKD
jgi:hypothetical protein